MAYLKYYSRRNPVILERNVAPQVKFCGPLSFALLLARLQWRKKFRFMILKVLCVLASVGAVSGHGRLIEPVSRVGNTGYEVRIFFTIEGWASQATPMQDVQFYDDLRRHLFINGDFGCLSYFNIGFIFLIIEIDVVFLP